MQILQQYNELFKTVAVTKYRYNNFYKIPKLTNLKYLLLLNKNSNINNLWALFFLTGQRPIYNSCKNNKIYLFINLTKLILKLYLYVYIYTIITKSVEIQKYGFNAKLGLIVCKTNFKINFNLFFKYYIQTINIPYTSYITFKPSKYKKFFWEFNQLFL